MAVRKCSQGVSLGTVQSAAEDDNGLFAETFGQVTDEQHLADSYPDAHQYNHDACVACNHLGWLVRE